MKTSEARSELDSITVGIELTLVSIIQGVALYFLIDTARMDVAVRHILLWPYILAGLLVIFVFWSRSILHVITVIRWPLEFGHNFLYIACALVEALLFTRLSSPRAWFAFTALFGAVGWIIFVYDLRLIRAHAEDNSGPASQRLSAVVTRDQWLNITLLIPGVFLFNLLCYLCIRLQPDLFLGRNWHLGLAAAQLAGFSAYLLYVMRYFKGLAPLIAQARAEWHRVGHEPAGTSSPEPGSTG